MRVKTDYTGWENKLLKVIEFDEGNQKWKCQCQCGNVIYYTSRQLQTNKPGSCGCLRSQNLVGRKFDCLEVRERTDKRDDNYNVYYLCDCKCGNTKLVTATDLLKGNVKSCGCMAAEHSAKLGKQIGEKTKEICIDGTNVRNLTMKTPKTNTSGIKGVTWDASRGKWKAQIRFKGKHYNLGRYSDIKDASQVRKLAEKRLFGNFLEWYENEYRKGAPHNE